MPDRPHHVADASAQLAQAASERKFGLALIGGGPGRGSNATDYRRLGFAMRGHCAADDVARLAARVGDLLWRVREEAYPVGYYCGVRDRDCNAVELSYGQSLSPRAPEGHLDTD